MTGWGYDRMDRGFFSCAGKILLKPLVFIERTFYYKQEHMFDFNEREFKCLS